jgi:Putative peptidoglycan binding domain
VAAWANGRIPDRALMGIPVNGRLIRPAAISFWAMWLAGKRAGVNMGLIEGPIRRTYRELSAQVAARRMWCNAGNCGNAAIPGTSNHGWGINIDLMTTAQRNFIDRRGAQYGWSKSWSDAAWEWWHITWRAGHYRGGLPAKVRVLKKGIGPGRDVRVLKRWLKQARRPKGGRYLPEKADLGPNYSRRIRTVVRRFQRDHGIRADGVVGPTTWAAIERAAAKQRRKWS